MKSYVDKTYKLEQARKDWQNSESKKNKTSKKQVTEIWLPSYKYFFQESAYKCSSNFVWNPIWK